MEVGCYSDAVILELGMKHTTERQKGDISRYKDQNQQDTHTQREKSELSVMVGTASVGTWIEVKTVPI